MCVPGVVTFTPILFFSHLFPRLWKDKTDKVKVQLKFDKMCY